MLFRSLNISAFIVVCEAFLCIQPHFGLWLKTFNVKPKVVSGCQEECGGAVVGKMPNITWLEGTFVDTIKGWQSGWFYITEPRDPAWVAAPEFRSGIPMRLTSWKEKGIKNGSLHSPGYARPPDTPVPTTGVYLVGVQSGAAPNSEQALRYDS